MHGLGAGLWLWRGGGEGRGGGAQPRGVHWRALTAYSHLLLTAAHSHHHFTPPVCSAEGQILTGLRESRNLCTQTSFAMEVRLFFLCVRASHARQRQPPSTCSRPLSAPHAHLLRYLQLCKRSVRAHQLKTCTPTYVEHLKCNVKLARAVDVQCRPQFTTLAACLKGASGDASKCVPQATKFDVCTESW